MDKTLSNQDGPTTPQREQVGSTALFAVLNEWLDVAKLEDDLAERSKDNPNGALAHARGRTLRNCARELSDCILANDKGYAREE